MIKTLLMAVICICTKKELSIINANLIFNGIKVKEKLVLIKY